MTEGQVDIDINLPPQHIYGNPGQVMYNMLRQLTQWLYEISQELVGELNDLIEAGCPALYLTLPSGVSFKIAEEIAPGQGYTVPNFVLPEASITGFTLDLPGFNFHWRNSWNFTVLWNVIFPKIANFPISDANLLWRDFSSGAVYQGTDYPDMRKYTLMDLTIDVGFFTLVFFMIKALYHIGFGHHAQKLSQKIASISGFKKSVSAYTESMKTSEIKTDAHTAAEKSTTAATHAETAATKSTEAASSSASALTKATEAASDAAEGRRQLSDLLDPLSVAYKITSVVNNIVTVLTKMDDALAVLADLGVDTTAIQSSMTEFGQNVVQSFEGMSTSFSEFTGDIPMSTHVTTILTGVEPAVVVGVADLKKQLQQMNAKFRIFPH